MHKKEHTKELAASHTVAVVLLVLSLVNVGRASADTREDASFKDLDRLFARETACNDAIKDRRFRNLVVSCDRVINDKINQITINKRWLATHDRKAFHEGWAMRRTVLLGAEMDAARYSLDVATGLLAFNYRTEARRRVAFARDLLKQVNQRELRTDVGRAYYARIRSNMVQIAATLQ
jgi:hypothetical protein